MIYLATASGADVVEAMRGRRLGQMVTPDAGNRVEDGTTWALDNGCYGSRWTPQRWSATLDRHAATPGCLWAVVPDVVGDADATDRLWARWWSAPMRRGYRAAYVAQDGCRYIPAGARAVFIGGTTEWKLGPEARQVAAVAKRLGLWLHMGRVNSLRRMRYAHALGCDSVDGTYLAYGPRRNLPTALGWMRRVAEPRLPLDQ